MNKHWVARYGAIITGVITKPVGLMDSVRRREVAWRDSVGLAIFAILVNSVVYGVAGGDAIRSAVVASYLIFLLAVYAVVWRFYVSALLDRRVEWDEASITINIAMTMSAFISVSYLSIVAVIYFFIILAIALVRLYGTPFGRAVVLTVLFAITSLLIELSLSGVVQV